MEVPVNTTVNGVKTTVNVPINTGQFSCAIGLDITYLKSKHGWFDIAKAVVGLMGLISYAVVGLDTVAGLGWVKFTSFCMGLSFGGTLALIFVYVCNWQKCMCCACNGNNINFTEWWNIIIGVSFFISAFGACFTTAGFKGTQAYGGLVGGTMFAWFGNLLHLAHYWYNKKTGE